MKILARRPVAFDGGVTVHELEDVDVPATRVIDRWYVDYPGLGYPEGNGEEERSAYSRPGKFRLRLCAGGGREILGWITGRNARKLAGFLAAYMEPSGGGPFDSALRLADGPEKRDRLLAFLDTPPIPIMGWSFPPHGTVPERPYIVLGDDDFLQYIFPSRDWERAGGHHFARAENLCLALDTTLAVGGHHVPRRKFAFQAEDQGAVAWDGSRVLCAASLHDLPAEFLDELDAGGRSTSALRPRLVAPLGFDPQFVVRIPAREEAQAILRRKPAFEVKLPPSPLLLVDTREAVPLPDDAPVFDDPEWALCLASWTDNGAYGPRETIFPSYRMLRDEPRYMVALRLAS